MGAKLIRRFSIGLAVLAASAYSASAQYDQPAGDVVGKDISESVSTQVASVISTGATGGGYSSGGGGGTGGGGTGGGGTGGGGTGTEPAGEKKSAIPVTRYFEGGNRGKSAGAHEKKVGVWVLGSYSTIDNSFINTKFDGDIVALVAGADYRLTNRIVAGVTLSYEDVDIDTVFNTGTIKTTGIGVGPYVVFRLSDRITADVNATYTVLDTDTTRTGGAVTANFDSDRFTAGANLSIGH